MSREIYKVFFLASNSFTIPTKHYNLHAEAIQRIFAALTAHLGIPHDTAQHYYHYL